MSLLPSSLQPRLPHGLPPELMDPHDWGRRIAMLAAAVLIGLSALLFAQAGDWAQEAFDRMNATYPLAVLVVTPLMFVTIAALTQRIAPEARGSGIPQVIAASRNPENPVSAALVSLRAALAKMLLTVAAIVGGASVGREGPTVQLGAAIMVQVHRLFRIPIRAGIYIAGGAAGVAAAFNTPLAGIAFAIEELAVAYEQRVAVLVMGAVMIAGLTAQGVAGNYTYFGTGIGGLPLSVTVVTAPLAGLLGGALGGLFSRLLLSLRGPDGRWSSRLGKRPLVVAFGCGIVVGTVAYLTHGATSGTGYAPTRAILEGQTHDVWFGPAKFVAAIATSVSGIPGGIFAPSLAVGAGVGQILAQAFPLQYAGVIVLIGMAGYFAGVVRAPLTAVIILSEATGSTNAILPLFATALIGDWAGAMVCRERLYHALARDFLPADAAEKPGETGEDKPATSTPPGKTPETPS